MTVRINVGDFVSFDTFYNGPAITKEVRRRHARGGYYSRPYDVRLDGSPRWSPYMLGKGHDDNDKVRHGRVTCVYPLTNEVDVRDSRGHTWRMLIRESRWLWD